MNWLRILAFFFLPSILWEDSYDPIDFRSGLSTVQTLGSDIYKSLEPAARAIISPHPVSLDTSRKPFVRLLSMKEDNAAVRGVWISQGFIDLVNHLPHALAIDRKRRGYFLNYLRSLEKSGDSIPPLPDIQNPSYWSDTVLNDQLSNFNSIMGIVIGTQLAQHYLGLYHKYEPRLKASEGENSPLNSLLTSDEWEQSYRRGLSFAMNASCMTEGFLPLCEGLAQLKQRPEWVVYFLPNSAHFKTMRKDMVRLQYKFLND